jgi:hypothetical protein
MSEAFQPIVRNNEALYNPEQYEHDKPADQHNPNDLGLQAKRGLVADNQNPEPDRQDHHHLHSNAYHINEHKTE